MNGNSDSFTAASPCRRADPEQAKARFHDGVLEVSMPAPKPQSNRRQIQIESDSKSSSTEAEGRETGGLKKVDWNPAGASSRLLQPGRRSRIDPLLRATAPDRPLNMRSNSTYPDAPSLEDGHHTHIVLSSRMPGSSMPA